MITRADSREESLAIPDSVRRSVDERDGQHCRVCGRFLGERRALHHIVYGGDARGMGGRRVHDVNEIITVCWLPGDGDCHQLVHSNKRLWQPLLLECARRSAITALQLRRWQLRSSAPRTGVAGTPVAPSRRRPAGIRWRSS